jgi:pyruvate, water dikinase
MVKENITWFKDLTIKDIEKAGGKGASLGEMLSLVPIPDGFVITAQAYEDFVNQVKNDIFDLIKMINIEDSSQLDKIAKDIRDIILKTEVPEELKKEIEKTYNELKGFVAVRSSATAEDLPEASFAGQQDTYLNVKGAEEVIDSVRKCWASLFTARAIYYRETNKFKHEEVLIAVVIQRMINSKSAGVMFTVNPVNEDRNEMIIEGAFGLGEMVVSGQITPDMYLITKDNLEIKEKNINEQETGLFRSPDGGNEKKAIENPSDQVLSDEHIIELSRLGLKIEKHYKKPMDIEWAVGEDNKMYIVQARPITTLK